MKRICILGDSHTAALKAGWDVIASDFPDTELSFFAAGGRLQSGLVVKDGALVPGNDTLAKRLRYTSGSETRIAGDYDAYILCGLALSLTNLIPIVRFFRSEGQRKDTRTSLSNACYRACFVGTCRVSLMGETLAKLRQITLAPAAMMVQPLPVARAWHLRLAQDGDDAIVARFMNAAMSEMAAGFDTRFVPQPPETLDVTALSTAATFYEDAVHMVDKQDDQHHANARYGAIMLKEAISALGVYP